MLFENCSGKKVNQRGKPLTPGGGTPILGHIRDVRKPADGCKFLTKNLRMGHNFGIILPENGCFPLN